jgi:Flp pilus assembly pilin Flp
VTSIEYALLSALIVVTIAGVCASLFAALSSEYGEIAAIFRRAAEPRRGP